MKIKISKNTLYKYLWNNVSVTPKNRSEDAGRRMYEKFTDGISKFLEENNIEIED